MTGNTRIFSIDPGTRTMGMSVIDIDFEGLRGLVRYAETHNSEHMLHRYQEAVLEFGELEAKFLATRDNLSRLLNHFRPDVVVAESPFFNPKRPTSAEPLMRLKQVITDVCIAFEIPLVWVAPQRMKRSIGANVKDSSKDNVREAMEVLFQSGVMVFDKKESGLESLSSCVEHTVDALGVGYTYLVNELF